MEQNKEETENPAFLELTLFWRETDNKKKINKYITRPIPWRRKWQLPPIFLPEKSEDRGARGLKSMGLQRVRHDWAIECVYSLLEGIRVMERNKSRKAQELEVGGGLQFPLQTKASLWRWDLRKDLRKQVMLISGRKNFPGRGTAK